MSRIVWFDGYVTNVDRTVRNTNMLMWHRRPWLINHGATLYLHHAPGWEQEAARARDPFPLLASHVLRARARTLQAVDQTLAMALGDGVLESILAWVPDEWLTSDVPGRSEDDTRAAYVRYLRDRLMAPRPFLPEAPRAVELTYDYAVIRVVPRVERGEQVNVACTLLRRRRFPRGDHRGRRGASARARPDARSRRRAGRAGHVPGGVRRRRRRRRARRPTATGPVPLAGVAAQHRHSGVGGAHRSHDRPGSGAAASV